MERSTVVLRGSGGVGRLAVDAASAEAPYEQVRQQVEALVAAGTLLPGDRLPTVRGLADELGLAANTVARAFRELEAGGVVVTRGRAGTTVASGAHTSEVALAALAARYVAAVRDAGLDESEALDAVRRAFRGA